LWLGQLLTSELSLSPVVPDHLTAVIAKLRILSASDRRSVRLGIIPGQSLKATDIETCPIQAFHRYASAVHGFTNAEKATV